MLARQEKWQHFSSLKKERRKGQVLPGPGGQTGPLGIMRRWFLWGWGGEDTPRLLRRKQALTSVAKGQPNRCFRRVPLWPPGPNRGDPTIFPKL
jgi:hypothetical protein